MIHNKTKQFLYFPYTSFSFHLQVQHFTLNLLLYQQFLICEHYQYNIHLNHNCQFVNEYLGFNLHTFHILQKEQINNLLCFFSFYILFLCDICLINQVYLNSKVKNFQKFILLMHFHCQYIVMHFKEMLMENS